MISLERGGLRRLDIAPDHVLSRPVELLQGVEVLALGRVTDEGQAVGPAPLAQRAVESGVEPLGDDPLVAGRGGLRVGVGGVGQRGEEPFGGETRGGLDGREEPARPGEQPASARAAAAEARLVDEKGQDRLAEMVADGGGVALVGDLDEFRGGGRIEQIGGGRLPTVRLGRARRVRLADADAFVADRLDAAS